MGCPFDPAQGKGSPLYACPVAKKGYHLLYCLYILREKFAPKELCEKGIRMNPVNLLNILATILAEEQVLISRLVAGGGTARPRRQLSRT
jgi:hypothetical protein